MVPELLRIVPLKVHVRSATQTDGAAPMYEIHCRWRNESLKPDDSFTYTEWSVWRTYDAFQTLDTDLRAQRQCLFAKMMVTVAFAPEHRVRMFFHQDQTARFLDKRQKELDYYLQRILLFSGVAEFVAGTGSRVLAAFLEADQHIACAFHETTALSPTAELLAQHSREALRTLNVDMHAAFSPSSSYASSSATASSFDAKRTGGSSTSQLTRRAIKQEIEDAIALQCGDQQLKRFRKRARAFRKENDPRVAADALVAFVVATFDAALATWLVQKFVATVKHTDKRAALRDAAGDLMGVDSSDSNDSASRKAAARKLKHADSNSRRSNPAAPNPAAPLTAKLARKQSSKEIMARVETSARGNRAHIDAFKAAAKALGRDDMTTTEFVAFVRATFGNRDARDILRLVADVVPLPHVERELRGVLAI